MRNAKESIKVFFSSFVAYIFIAILSTHFEGKTNNEVFDDIYLRILSVSITGLFGGICVMFGQDLYIYLREKNKKK
jgi:hypothetical protein